MQIEHLLDKVYNLSINYLPKLTMAILTFIVGLYVIKYLNRITQRTLEKNKVDPSLSGFLKNAISILLRLLLLLSVINMLGVQITSIIAFLGAIGLAIGMALSNSLQNFASGIIIIFLKPFKVGDYIESDNNEAMGSVSEINIFNTILKTPDNKTIIVPNGILTSNALTNYSTESSRRVDLTFGISYDDDISHAKSVILSVVNADKRISQHKEVEVYVSELGDSAINLLLRVWTNTQDYWPLKFDLVEKIKTKFDEEKISIPYPKQDLYVYNK